MLEWKRNLVFVWLSQFLSIAGFMLALPFSPFYIQELGVVDEKAVTYWTGIAAAAPSIGLGLTAPIWGILADRYGRKLMMIRANFGAMVVLGAMAFSPNVYVFVVLRFVQGFFTGTMNAAMTFVASYSPQNKQGMALGALSTAVYAGATAGPFIGGFVADAVGYRNAFLGSSLLLLLSAMFVLFGVREKFIRPESGGTETVPAEARPRLAALGPAAAILVLICVTSFARRFDQAMLPLYVQNILGGAREGAAGWTGVVVGIAALGAVLGGFTLGRLADRFSPQHVGKLSAAGAALFQLLIGLLPRLLLIIPSRFMMAFWAAGLDPVFLAWLSRITPREKRGIVFGYSVTAKSLGWSLTPLISAAVAVQWGIRNVFAVGSIFLLLLIPIVSWVTDAVAGHTNSSDQPATSAAQSS